MIWLRLVKVCDCQCLLHCGYHCFVTELNRCTTSEPVCDQLSSPAGIAAITMGSLLLLILIVVCIILVSALVVCIVRKLKTGLQKYACNHVGCFIIIIILCRVSE